MIDGILIEILALMIIAHHRLRVFVATHHLYLPIGEPLVERPRDGRPPQVMGRELSYSAPVAPTRHDVPDHPCRKWFRELQCAVVDQRLEEIGFRPIAVQMLPPLRIQLKVVFDGCPYLIWQG